MQPADGLQGRDGPRRSTLDVIINQIRRKRAASDRKPLGRFLSRGPEQAGGVSEDEVDRGGHAPTESERDVGWGRVCALLKKLGKKANSWSLSLAHCDLIATDLLELASLLHFFPQLEEVDVSWNELIGGSLPALTSHLQQVGGVRMLLLCGCRLNADDIIALGDVLSCVPLLEVLDLSWNSSVGGAALQGLLGKLPPALRQLHLVACQLTAADAAALGASALPRLSLLDASCNPQLAQEVDGGGFRQLAASLGHAPSLATLRLRGCSLTSEAVHALGDWLRCGPALRELDLSCNRTLAGALGRVAPHLAHLSHLESLDLHLCGLSAADMDALIQVLPALVALTELNVSANQEVGGVVRRLVSALPLAQMRCLPLSCCSLTEESLTSLALAVPYLCSLDVSWSKVVGGRLASLLDVLQPSIIQELRLSSCDLTSDDLGHLAAASRRGCLSSLRLMDLSYNGSVGDAGWSRLFSAGGLGSLEDVDVSLRPSGSAPCSGWLPALLGALPRLPALSRLAMRRWSVGLRQRQQLAAILRGRSVLLEAEPPATESAEGGGPEE